jgi:argininosuccinate lyase
MSNSAKPWEHAKSGGSETDPLAARFVESLSYDTRLYRHDIAGSIAHARMLAHVGLISEHDLAEIERGLEEIETEIDERGRSWPGWKVDLEDVHMCIEAALIEKVGDPGRKLHTGRSRNDQVALDLLLWSREATDSICGAMRELIGAFVRLAEEQGELVMPSYTHLQRAQPVVVGGELMAWAAALDGCIDRFESLRPNDASPLGSGAIAGSSLPLDRQMTAEALIGDEPLPEEIAEAFDEMLELTEEELRAVEEMDKLIVSSSSMQSTASRDVAIDFVYGLSMTAQWLSRWAEQWIIYMTAEFGFLSIGDAYTTGSSMMPQKRNPDMLELIRGRCGNVYGHLMALLTMCKGLTIGYNRDLQEDKRHLFAAYDTVKDCLEMATRIVRSAKFNERRIREGLDRGFLDATSLAEYLVTKGVPFRTAHQIVGQAVRHCEATDRYKLEQLKVAEFNEIAARHGYADAVADDVYDWLGPDNVVRRYQTYGNAGLSGFRQQLAEWRERLDGWEDAEAGEPKAGPGAMAIDQPLDRDTAAAAADLFGEASAEAGVSPDRELIEAYRRESRTLDDLPYTDQFEAIYAAAGAALTRQQLFHRLHNLRKAGRLPTGLKAWEKAPRVTPDQAELLTGLVEAAVGRLSHRDQLPYTEAFEQLVQTYNDRAGLSFSPYQVWRVIAKLAK